MGDYPFFPVFIDLSEKKLLVVGAGKIARRRITVLSKFTPELTVIAPSALPEVEKLSADGKLRLIKKPFEDDDLKDADMVFAATNDHELNDRIYDLCKELGITVNVSTDRNKSDFYFPGIAMKGDLVAGITASGKNHAAAKEASKRIRDLLEDID